jgi:hypothetical protein
MSECFHCGYSVNQDRIKEYALRPNYSNGPIATTTPTNLCDVCANLLGTEYGNPSNADILRAVAGLYHAIGALPPMAITGLLYDEKE